MWCVLDTVLVPSQAPSMWADDMSVCLKQAAWHVKCVRRSVGLVLWKACHSTNPFSTHYQVNECQLFQPQAPAHMISHSWYKMAQVKSRSRIFYKFCQVDQRLTMQPITHWGSIWKSDAFKITRSDPFLVMGKNQRLGKSNPKAFSGYILWIGIALSLVFDVCGICFFLFYFFIKWDLV